MSTEAIHLGYHYILPEQGPGPTCNPQRLENTIIALKDEGYKFMTCGQVVDCIRAGNEPPAKHATLSFDDGLRSQYEVALPILMEHSVPATVFYTTCALDSKLPPVIGFQVLIDRLGAEKLKDEILPKVFQGTPYLDLLDPDRYDNTGRKAGEPEEMRGMKWMFNHFPSQAFRQEMLDAMLEEHLAPGSQQRIAAKWFMTAEQLKKMQGNGMEIASHTVSHPPFDISGMDEVRNEVYAAKNTLRDLLEVEVPTFGWPFGGEFRASVVAVVRDHHQSAWNFYGDFSLFPKARLYENLYNIPRVNEQAFQPEEFFASIR